MKHKGQVCWNDDFFFLFFFYRFIDEFSFIDLIRFQKMPETFWIENRINYRNICRLCDAIDTAIGPITMVSFGNNLYFVCVQLLKSLKFV